MFFGNKNTDADNNILVHLYKKSGIYIAAVIILFVIVGALTTVAPAYRLTSHTISSWTSDLNSSTFLYLLGMENRAFKAAYPDDMPMPDLSNTLFQMATSIKPNDTRSLLGQELPGFAAFSTEIIVAGKGTDFTNLPVESAAPLEDILKDREAVVEEPEEPAETEKDSSNKEETDSQLSTGNRNVVFIYNTHNRESFLPHLPGVTDPDLAQHGEVNITKVSERLAKELEAEGIGTTVAEADIMKMLNKRGWEYHQAYAASREVVKEAFATNNDIQYVFDIHRDANGREETTIEISGKSYARIMFVVGADYASYGKNLALAWDLHNLIEKKYPDLSRGVITKKGPLNNGVYNQDLSGNAVLIEFGGVENTLEELYRTAEAVAEVFSDYYWDAEKVSNNQ